MEWTAIDPDWTIAAAPSLVSAIAHGAMQSDMQIIQVAVDAPGEAARRSGSSPNGKRGSSPNAVKQLSKLMNTLSSRGEEGGGEAEADILHSIYGLATRASIKQSDLMASAKFVKKLGEGSFATVDLFQAAPRWIGSLSGAQAEADKVAEADEYVVVKQLKRRSSLDLASSLGAPRQRANFLQEAIVLRALRHRNVVYAALALPNACHLPRIMPSLAWRRRCYGTVLDTSGQHDGADLMFLQVQSPAFYILP